MLKNDAILVILCYNYCKIKTVENKIILGDKNESNRIIL